MSTNNSQIGNTPSEPLIKNKHTESNIGQSLSPEFAITNQPPVQLTTAKNIISSQTSSIVSHPQFNDLTSSQHAARGSRCQQKQQRGFRSQQAYGPRYEPWMEHRRQYEEQRQTFHDTFHCDNPWIDRTDQMAYRLHLADEENTYARDEYEQQQVNELENFFAQEQLALVQDEIEQLNGIDAVEKMKENEQTLREQWEQEQLNELQGFTMTEKIQLIQDDTINQLKQIDTLEKMDLAQQQEHEIDEVIQLQKANI